MGRPPWGALGYFAFIEETQYVKSFSFYHVFWILERAVV